MVDFKNNTILYSLLTVVTLLFFIHNSIIYIYQYHKYMLLYSADGTVYQKNYNMATENNTC